MDLIQQADGSVVPDLEIERRKQSLRTEAPKGWSAILFMDQPEFFCNVLDISSNGVGLMIDAAEAEMLLLPEQSVTMRLQTLDLFYSRVGKIRWVRSQDGRTLCGVELQTGVSFDPSSHRLDIREVRIDPACALKITPQLAVRRRLLPFAEIDGVMHVAYADDGREQGLQMVERMLKQPAQFWPTDTPSLELAIRSIFGDGLSNLPAAGGNDAFSLSERILQAAFLRQASDIHIDPGENSLTIRFRVDGILEVFDEFPANVMTEVTNRFKVMGKLDIAEKRAPQDGRFSYQFQGNGRRIDVRIASLPTKHGERLTLRLLALQTDALTLDRLGLDPEHRRTIELFLRRSQGLMVLTGPTGSGKTTTLYASIRMLLQERRLNVMTIEDPIEYAIDGIAQCEVDTADKVSFAGALRSILRHDPDVVMVGEIRDQETADIAMKAALTGHLVLGTLHTNSAAAAITRLTDMGVDPYLVAATLRLAVAQRLSRRLCPYCRTPRRLSQREAMSLSRPELEGSTVFEPGGCLYCTGRGFKGRVGLYEMLELNPDWARQVAQGAGESKITEQMEQAGVRFLLDDAVGKLLAGDIHISEALQIAASW
jgi:general secretion pathway protein E